MDQRETERALLSNSAARSTEAAQLSAFRIQNFIHPTVLLLFHGFCTEVTQAGKELAAPNLKKATRHDRLRLMWQLLAIEAAAWPSTVSI